MVVHGGSLSSVCGAWLSIDEESLSVGAGSSSAIDMACPPCHVSGGAIWLVPLPLPFFVAVVAVVVVVVAIFIVVVAIVAVVVVVVVVGVVVVVVVVRVVTDL